MMIVRRADERFHTQLGWLDSRHTFSFAEHYDPEYMGFRALRVINEDRVSPGAGFPGHSHRDMEIISYVLSGAIEHKDNLGTGSFIRPGDVQRMSAGTGVVHSEFNASKTEPVHFLQIWIVPAERGQRPSYEQRSFSEAERRGALRLVASADGRDGSLTVHQDVALYVASLDEGQRVTYELEPARHAWVQMVRGAVRLNAQTLGAGDGAALGDEPRVELIGAAPAEILLFDLA